MKKITQYFLLLTFAVLSTIAFDSCQTVEGCTDPEAENYNPDADDNDGSCTYARDKFLGTYEGIIACQPPLPGEEPFTMVISESLSSNAEVLITFLNLEDLTLPELSATVSGSTMVINQETVEVPLDVNNPDLLTEIEYSGEATISGDDLSGTLNTKAVLLQLSVPCDITAVKQ